jgi:hypothetical protein
LAAISTTDGSNGAGSYGSIRRVLRLRTDVRGPSRILNLVGSGHR